MCDLLGVVLLVVVWGGLTVGLILFVCLFVLGYLFMVGCLVLGWCSWWIWFGFGLLLLIVFLFGLGFGYVG